MREEDKFLVDTVEADEVGLMRGGCRGAGIWGVGEVRRLGGAHVERRGAAQSGGALERGGVRWGGVTRRVAQSSGGNIDVTGRRVRAGAGSRGSRALGKWGGAAAWDWSLVAWAAGGVIHLGIPQSGPGKDYLECRELARVCGSPPRWMKRGTS